MWGLTLPLVVWLMDQENMPFMVSTFYPGPTEPMNHKVEHRFETVSMHGHQAYWRAIQEQPQNAIQVYNC